jgi:uncharacterized protein (TIGR04255 family)
VTERVRYRPFTGDTNKRVRLRDNPLALVLCQVRWPELGHLQTSMKSVALEFGGQLAEYPIYEEVQGLSYQLTPEGVHQAAGDALFHWRSIDQKWHVVLGRRFITLYAVDYVDFEDFNTRLLTILQVVTSQLRIPLVDRIGMRYVNRLADPLLLANLSQYLPREVLGFAGLELESANVSLKTSTNFVRYDLDDVALQVKAALLGPNEVPDPAIAPVDVPSWVLDLDAFSEQLSAFDAESIASGVGKLSDSAYDFFKMIMTDELLAEFGSQG